MNQPFVSIIIPIKNAQNYIKKCLNSLLNLNYPNYEVIVINDDSTDETGKILASYSNIKILTTSGVGPSKARNIAIEQARGEFVAFTDADCVVDTDWLVELLKGFTDERVAGVGGIQKSPDDDSWFGKKVHEFLDIFGFISDYMKSAKVLTLTNHNPTCNVMYRKSILIELGGFLENLWPGEDVELDYRIKKNGGMLMFNPKAIVYHYRPPDWRAFGRMMFRYGWAQGYLVRKYGFFRKIHFLPLILFCLVGLIIFCTLIYPDISKIIFFSLFLILLINRLFKPKKNNILSLILIILGSISWNIGFIKGVFIKEGP